MLAFIRLIRSNFKYAVGVPVGIQENLRVGSHYNITP